MNANEVSININQDVVTYGRGGVCASVKAFNGITRAEALPFLIQLAASGDAFAALVVRALRLNEDNKEGGH